MSHPLESLGKYRNELVFIASTATLLVCAVFSAVLSSLAGGEQALFSFPSTIFIADQEEFSCGGGPFSFYMASLISTSCDRSKIHTCCAAHDICYDSLYLNQTYCDEIFCGCLSNIQASLYCERVAHSGLCLATHVFGHMFHWSSNCPEGVANCDAAANHTENSRLDERRPDQQLVSDLH